MQRMTEKRRANGRIYTVGHTTTISKPSFCRNANKRLHLSEMNPTHGYRGIGEGGFLKKIKALLFLEEKLFGK